MKQYQITNAYDILSVMADFKLPTPVSYKLWILARQLEPTQQFIVSEKKKLVGEYNGKIDSNGCVIFDSKDDEAGFVQALTELAETDIVMEIEPVSIPLSCMESINLSIADISKLDGFVIFT